MKTNTLTPEAAKPAVSSTMAGTNSMTMNGNTMMTDSSMKMTGIAVNDRGMITG